MEQNEIVNLLIDKDISAFYHWLILHGNPELSIKENISTYNQEYIIQNQQP